MSLQGTCKDNKVECDSREHSSIAGSRPHCCLCLNFAETKFNSIMKRLIPCTPLSTVEKGSMWASGAGVCIYATLDRSGKEQSPAR